MPAPSASDLIDIVDERDHVVGAEARGAVLRAGHNFRTVHVFLIATDGRFLLQRLAAQRSRHPGRWGSSVAGYLHAGESYRDGAQRRLEEELGLTTHLEEFGIVPVQDGASTKFVALFTGAAQDPIMACDPDHVSALGWWRPEDLATTMQTAPDNLTPTFRDLFSVWVRATAR